MASGQEGQQLHAPYSPKTAAVGGLPTVGVDVPICSVFLVLFICGAAGNMTIFQLNKRRGHKFLMSGMLFGFCMARIVTQIMRIVWACYPTDVSVAIAATIFVAAGVLILFLINLIFAQRMLRAAHPHFGWHKALSRVFLALYILIGLMLIMVITATVQSFYTLDQNIRRIDRDLQLTTAIYFMSIAFAPIPMVIIGLVIPRKTRLEKFGTGRWRSKIAILLATSTLLCLGAAFRCGTSWKTPRPRADPAWYDAKWCFYIFNFTVEIIVVYLYIFLRIDRRFHIPDGAKGPGDYSESSQERSNERDGERPNSSGASDIGILSEEEVFDDAYEKQEAKDEEAGRPRQ